MKLIFKMDEEVPASKLDRNVRAHGNFSEYVPIFLVLLMILELSGNASFNYLLLICSIFAYGRLAHAICFAFKKVNRESVVLVAGKGHEKFQEIGDNKKPFDDAHIIANILNT